MPAKIISVVSQKGGVTKSTTCINLGVGLARHGKRVLLVDNDPQGSMTISLGFQHPEKIGIKTNDMLSRIILKQPIEPGEGILRNTEGVDLMPSGTELAAMEMNMTDEKDREAIMKRYLETVRFMYDFIIIDCMPSLSLLTINALAAADYLLIPTQPQFLSAKGMNIWQFILAAFVLLILIPVGIACIDASDNALIEARNRAKASLHV